MPQNEVVVAASISFNRQSDHSPLGTDLFIVGMGEKENVIRFDSRPPLSLYCFQKMLSQGLTDTFDKYRVSLRPRKYWHILQGGSNLADAAVYLGNRGHNRSRNSRRP